MNIKIIIIVFFLANTLFSLPKEINNQLFKNNFDAWIQTNGPDGGGISDFAISPDNPDKIYALTGKNGLYYSEDQGKNWVKATDIEGFSANEILILPEEPNILYSNYQILSKSYDNGKTWENLTSGISDILYGGNHKNCFHVNSDGNFYLLCYNSELKFVVYKSENKGQSWQNITGDLDTPLNPFPAGITISENGRIFAAVNDRDLLTWHKGKIFYSDNNGENWKELDYGQQEDRYITNIFANPYKKNEIWFGEYSLYNDGAAPPNLFISDDNGENWNSVYLEGGSSHILDFSRNGNVYISNPLQLFYTKDQGNSFEDITPSSNLNFNLGDIKVVKTVPGMENTLFLAGITGVLKSENLGEEWFSSSNGIISTSINLIYSDPNEPGRIYGASNSAEGFFKTENYGYSWDRLNVVAELIDDSTITERMPWGDEVLINPHNSNHIIYIAEVPWIFESFNRGETWELSNTLRGNQTSTLNFSSVYAIAQSKNKNSLYALNNGFGIYKGSKPGNDWDWNFLNLSEIDYSYTLAVDPDNDDIVYSGYSRKPFQTKAMIRKSSDGGSTWTTALEIDGAEAVTSVLIDPINSDNIFATAAGETTGGVWMSRNAGINWEQTNSLFHFTTIHSFAQSPSNPEIQYAGVWGGGTYQTKDNGLSWNKLSSEKTLSAASIAVDPQNPQILYFADRTLPVLYKSIDGGETWETFFNAGEEYRRLMSISIAPGEPEIIIVSAMKQGGPGKLGAVFMYKDSNWSNINDTLPKVPLNITIDNQNPPNFYAVLHESGIFKSSDYGNSWQNISGNDRGLPNSGFSNLYISPAVNEILYLIGGCDILFDTFESAGLNPDSVNGIYKSEDGGKSWNCLNSGVLGKKSGQIKSIVFYNQSPEIIYAAAENGLFYTSDGGATWTEDTSIPFTALSGVSCHENTLFVYTNGAGVLQGEINNDYSLSWNSQSKIKTRIFFSQVLRDYGNDSILYASAYPGGIFKSNDLGKTWHEKNFGIPSFQVHDPLRQGYYAIDISRSKPEILYLGLYRKGMYKSVNHGETWYPVNGGDRIMSDQKITSLAIDHDNENIVYCATEDGVYITENGGWSWREFNTGLASKDIKIIYMSPAKTLFAGSRGYGLYYLEENQWKFTGSFGEWGVIWPIWDNRPLYQYTSLLIHPLDEQKRLIGTFPQGIYKSIDGGESWKESNIGWTFDGVFSLICHPENPQTVYSGTYNGINISYDFGDTWIMSDTGWPDEQWVFSIDFDPENSQTMVACSKNGENEGTGREGFHGTVMKSLNSGLEWFPITEGLNLDQEFYSIIIDKFDPSIYYLATERQGIMITKNSGDSWEEWNEGLTNKSPGINNNVTSVLKLSADYSTLYFGSDGSGVFRRMVSPILPVNNLSAKVDSHKVTLKWQFEDLNQNFSSYQIYRGDSYFSELTHLTPITVIQDMNQKNYTDSTIAMNTQYYYCVTTKDQENYENNHFYVLGPIVDYGLYIQTLNLDTAFVGYEYTDTLTASGGTLPYSWNLTEGNLPLHLSLDSSGIIQGIPEYSGDYQFQLTVSDSRQPPRTASYHYHITVLSETDIKESEEIIYPDYLFPIYPNPFQDKTMIKFSLKEYSQMKIEIYNILGLKIKTFEQKRNKGIHTISWNTSGDNGKKIPSGMYFITFQTKDYQKTRKMMLLR